MWSTPFFILFYFTPRILLSTRTFNSTYLILSSTFHHFLTPYFPFSTNQFTATQMRLSPFFSSQFIVIIIRHMLNLTAVLTTHKLFPFLLLILVTNICTTPYSSLSHSRQHFLNFALIHALKMSVNLSLPCSFLKLRTYVLLFPSESYAEADIAVVSYLSILARIILSAPNTLTDILEVVISSSDLSKIFRVTSESSSADKAQAQHSLFNFLIRLMIDKFDAVAYCSAGAWRRKLWYGS